MSQVQKAAPFNPDIKRIDIREFREVGFLQELNRLMLHPLGLALEVIEEDCEQCEGDGSYSKMADCTTGGKDCACNGPRVLVDPCDGCGGKGHLDRLGGIWDYRDDPEGILFGGDQIDREKAIRVEEELDRHRGPRATYCGPGCFIQPLPRETP